MRLPLARRSWHRSISLLDVSDRRDFPLPHQGKPTPGRRPDHHTSRPRSASDHHHDHHSQQMISQRVLADPVDDDLVLEELGDADSR
jgi:hypothetical protein